MARKNPQINRFSSSLCDTLSKHSQQKKVKRREFQIGKERSDDWGRASKRINKTRSLTGTSGREGAI